MNQLKLLFQIKLGLDKGYMKKLKNLIKVNIKFIKNKKFLFFLF
jgi:hypothetical protein